MSENVLHTLQQLVQDVIAPDVRELKVRITALEKAVESLEKHMDVRFTLIRSEERRPISSDYGGDCRIASTGGTRQYAGRSRTQRAGGGA